MAHEHPVVDADKLFIIDPIARVVKNAESKKTTLVQNDHNSERLTFEVDRYVEGHDMLESASVRIHYDNVGTNRLKVSGVYEVDDIQPNPEDSTKVIFTWLVSQNATSLVGVLNFSITFECETDGVVEYRWSTVLNTSEVVISEGLDNGGAVAGTYNDILTKWKNELYSIVYTYPTFAEVCRWDDDNLDDEDRIGYFVTVETSDITEETLMVKATAASEIRGVTMESPGFAANAGDYKFDDKGELLAQYDYVGFSGFIPVIDNGTCSVNGWCKCGDNGTAIPANDGTGFRVIERVDDEHVLILVEPQGAISTLMAKDTEIVNALANHVATLQNADAALQNLINNHANNKSNPHGVTAVQVGARPATWTPTAFDVKAVPLIDAKSNSYDMDTIITNKSLNGLLYQTNSATLGTPYAKGVCGLAECVILNISSSVNYGAQFAFMSGGNTDTFLYWRTLRAGVISNWTTGFLPLDCSAALTGIKLQLYNGQGQLYCSTANTSMMHRNVANDDTNNRWLAVQNSLRGTLTKAVLLGDVIDGVSKVYNMLGEHNYKEYCLPLTGGTLSGSTIGLRNDVSRIVDSGNGMLLLQVLETAGVTNPRRQLNLENSKNCDVTGALKLYDIAASGTKGGIVYSTHNVTAGTTDLTAGTSALETDCYYDVYK